MEHVNNDMDDLFRKAGDLYPLKTSESDWEGLQVKLKAEGLGEPGAAPVPGTARGKKRRWLFLLLLIPFALGSAIHFYPTQKNQPQTAVLHSTTKNDGMKNEKTNPSVSRMKLPAAIPDPAVSNLEYAGKNRKQEINIKQSAPASLVVSRNNNKIGNKNDDGNNRLNIFSAADENSSTLNSLSAGTAVAESKSLFEPGIKPLSLTVTRPEETILVIAPGINQKDLHPSLTMAKKKTNPANRISKGLYAGIFGGPDVSTIHLQSVKNVGFGIGVQVGYRFNNRFSLESGLIWDKKYYYTSGEYFDKSKTPISPTEKILNLNGYCNMFEIPLDLRYDFARKADHGFFVKAGFSSYLMKKEHYQINAINLGWNVSYPGTYHNTGNYYFSILQLGAGYEHQIGAKTNIRIEPYIKIPLQGIGIGNMPISSAGLYIGISHLFR